MRVIAGSAKGRRLKTGRSPGVRPTTDRVKEALFNILRDRVEEAVMLDLYSGFGGIGIEALSRGAKKVFFIESDRAVIKTMEANIAACGFLGRAAIHETDIFRFIKLNQPSFDLIFADPPYDTRNLRKLLPAIGRGDIISANGLFVLEHFRKTKLPCEIGDLEIIRSYKYGETALSLFRKRNSGS